MVFIDNTSIHKFRISTKIFTVFLNKTVTRRTVVLNTYAVLGILNNKLSFDCIPLYLFCKPQINLIVLFLDIWPNLRCLFTKIPSASQCPNSPVYSQSSLECNFRLVYQIEICRIPFPRSNLGIFANYPWLLILQPIYLW